MTTNTQKAKDEFSFEIEGEQGIANLPAEKPVIDVVDDTPPEDRGRTPLPEDIVRDLENDELDEYSEKVKTRLKQMKKVWHDERRAKEAADRERQEALNVTQRLLEENRKLKTTLSQGEKALVDTAGAAAQLELDAAKKAFKEAYEAGNADLMADAQEKMTAANIRLNQTKNFKPAPLQDTENGVDIVQGVQKPPAPDRKTVAWQERNKWYGTEPDMTALALGIHQKLSKQYGESYIGTDDYWADIDDTMRRRFPEYFGEDTTATGGGKPGTRKETRAATVVAPASRSTSSKKIVLTQSQVNLAKKLGLTPEQYAREVAKTLEK